MATIVHGLDKYVALEVAGAQTVGEDPSYPSSWHRVPFAGETMRYERVEAAQSAEISRAGAETNAGYMHGFWRGEFTTPLSYNGIYQHVLLCSLMGGCEGFVADKSPGNHATTANTGNTHYYVPQSFRAVAAGSIGAVPPGLALRIWKAGPNNTGANAKCEKALYVFVTGARFFQDENGHPLVTWTVEGGAEPTLVSVVGVTPQAEQVTLRRVFFGDLAKDPTHPKLPSGAFGGANIAAFELDRWEMTMRNGLEWPKRRNLTSLDTPNTPGHTGPVVVEASFAKRLEQLDLVTGGAGKTYYELIAPSVRSGVRIRYISAVSLSTNPTLMVDVALNLPYCLQFDIPISAPVGGQAPVADGDAVRYEWQRRGLRGLITWNGAVASPSAWKVPFHVQMFMKATDDGDAKINPPNTGGNDPHSSLL